MIHICHFLHCVAKDKEWSDAGPMPPLPNNAYFCPICRHELQRIEDMEWTAESDEEGEDGAELPEFTSPGVLKEETGLPLPSSDIGATIKGGLAATKGWYAKNAEWYFTDTMYEQVKQLANDSIYSMPLPKVKPPTKGTPNDPSTA